MEDDSESDNEPKTYEIKDEDEENTQPNIEEVEETPAEVPEIRER